jgi:hypothetical protein
MERKFTKRHRLQRCKWFFCKPCFDFAGVPKPRRGNGSKKRATKIKIIKFKINQKGRPRMLPPFFYKIKK